MQTPILAWTLGGPEMILIFCLVLLLFGAKKLPQLARGVGKSMGEFRKAKDEFEAEIKSASDVAEQEWDKDKDKDKDKKKKKSQEANKEEDKKDAE